MAGKKKAAKKSAKSVPPTSEEIRERSIEAAMSLTALQGWRDTSLNDIAIEADLPLAALRAEFSGKPAILVGFAAAMDRQMLQNIEPNLAGEPTKDRLFELIMNRMDAMQPYKEALKSILIDLIRDLPRAAMLGVGSLRCSVRWMLEGAQIDSWGPFRGLQEKGLALIYLSVLRVWLKDDDPDMGKTMAALDKALNRVDEVLEGLRSPGLFRSKKNSDENPDEDATVAD